MAIFSSHTSIVQRSKGQNAIATSAYNSRSNLTYYFTDNKYNTQGEITWNYSSKEGLAYSKIIAPDHAPDWVFDREKLWNRAEEVEKRADGQTARKIMKALPVELTLEQNIELINEFAKAISELGMVVDVNIHDDAKHNPHAHLMLTMRELKEDRYGNIDFAKVKNRDWGKKEFVNWHRELFADLTNKHLAKNGFDVRVSHLSYKEQGIDLTPTKHIGPAMNITNSELVKNNLEILEENYQKILEQPSRILDKLTVYSPVFTKEQIASALEKVLSHEFMSGQIHEIEGEVDSVIGEGGNHKKEAESENKEKEIDPKTVIPPKDLEGINKEYSAKFMELHNKIMNSPELSMVIESDLKGRTLYTTTKRQEMEERYLSTVDLLHKRGTHALNIESLDSQAPTLKETIDIAGAALRKDIKRGIEQMFGLKASFADEDNNKGEMSDEQRRAVLEILNGKNISILEGIPGSGKTVSMKEIVKQYKRAGKKVIGVAPSSAAALVLGKETGIEAKNASLWRKNWTEAKGDKFDLFLRGDYFKEERYKDLSRDEDGSTKGGFAPILKTLVKGDMTKTELTKDHVMIIDEASMMELSNMDYMLSEAERVGAKVILVGDNNQLHGVGWLGAFKKAIDICGTNRLEESRRQQNSLHREATKLLGQYRIREALKIYLDDKSIEIDRGELNCRSRLINEYIDSYIKSAKKLENDDVATLRTQVISTYTNEAASKLNNEVRQQLKDAGIVKGREYNINVGDKKIPLSRGDQIVFTRNYNYLGSSGIYNGEVGTILSMTKPDEYGNSFITTLVSKADGTKEAVIIDTKKFSEFGDTRLLDYGYAVTSHKLQGASVDYNFLFFEKGMGYEALNVLLTRHRQYLKCFIDSNLLDEVAYESVGDVSEKENLLKASLRYEIGTEEKHLDALVKLASKRVNTSFAGDYKNMGLTDEDKHLKHYIDKTHESIEIIREISKWQSIELRKTGIKPALWDHERWDDFKTAKGTRNSKAKYIVENYPDFKDRIVQLGMNFETIRKHAEVRKTFVDERYTELYEREHYKDLVYAIDEVNFTSASKAYKKLKEEIADNYSSISELRDEETFLSEKHDELKFAIDGEKNFREKLIPNYLSRIYKQAPEEVLAKFKELSETKGSIEEAAKRVVQKPNLLGDLKGVGIGKLLGIGKGRKDAIANTDNLEHQLLSYTRSEKLEAEYARELESQGVLKELTEIRTTIDTKTQLLPNSLDDLFLDSFHEEVISNSPGRPKNKILLLNNFKSTELFESIKLGIHKAPEDKQRAEEEHFNPSASQTSQKASSDPVSNEEQKSHAVRGLSEDSREFSPQFADKMRKTTTSYNRIEWDDVNAKLGPYTYESVFRDFASSINPDGPIEKKNSNSISCGSLNMDLKTGLWHRFSTGEGGNIYDFVAQGIGKGRKEALEILAGKVGVRKSGVDYEHAANVNHAANTKNEQNATREDVPRDDWVPQKNLPYDVPAFNPKRDLSYLADKEISITNTYEYRSKDSGLLGYTIRTMESRTDKETGEIRQVKQVMPVTYCHNEARGKSRWQLKGFLDKTDSKPIYNAHLIGENPEKPVLIVEGEKAADHASKILPEYNVISWMGGTGSVRKVDWAQLQGKEVIIWPDNDRPGIEAARFITSKLDKINGFYGLARVIDVESLKLPEKWDLADDLPEHLSLDKVKDTIHTTISSDNSLEVMLSNNHEKSIGEDKTGQRHELYQAIDVLEKQGRIDFDPKIVSTELHKDALVSIILSYDFNSNSNSTPHNGEIQKSNGLDLVSCINDAQDIYENKIRKFDQKYKIDPNADKKDILIHSLTRDAYISEQVKLGRDELPSFHYDLIKAEAGNITSKMVRYNDVENMAAGSKMKQVIDSEEFKGKLIDKNTELANNRLSEASQKALKHINLKIAIYRSCFEQAALMGKPLDLDNLRLELQKVSPDNYNSYIEERLGRIYEQHKEELNLKLEETLLNSNHPKEIGNTLVELNDFKAKSHDLYAEIAMYSKDYHKNYEENEKAYFEDIARRKEIEKFTISTDTLLNKGIIDNRDVLDFMKENKIDTNSIKIASDHFGAKLEVHEVETKIAEFERDTDKAKTLDEILAVIERRENFFSSLDAKLQYKEAHSPEILKVIEMASKNNKANLTLELDKKVRLALSVGIKDEKVQIHELKELKPDETHKYASDLGKDIHKLEVVAKLEELGRQKTYSKNLKEMTGLIEKENTYLAGLYPNMDQFNYDSTVASKIQAAHNVNKIGIIDRMYKSIAFASTNKLMSNEDMHAKLKGASDPHAAEHSITNVCVHHNEKIAEEHLKQFRKGYAVEFGGKWHEDPKEYLDHWKKNYASHIIPTKSIEKAIEHHELQMSKSHDLGGPSL